MRSNKTGAGETLDNTKTGWNTLWISASNELLVQTHLRMPEIFPETHLKDIHDRKHTKTKKNISSGIAHIDSTFNPGF